MTAFLDIAPIVVSSVAAVVSGCAAYIAWSNGRRTRIVTVRLAGVQDRLKSFDHETEELEKKFDSWNAYLGDLGYLGGHLSSRTIAARLRGQQARLTGVLSQLATAGPTHAKALKKSVEDAGALADEMLSDAVAAEREGEYRKGFFRDALHPDSEWIRKQLELRNLQLRCSYWYEKMLRRRRADRRVLEAELLDASAA